MEKSSLQETLVVSAFFLTILGCIFAEAVWLSKKGWAGFGGSFVLLFVTNVVGFVVGGFLIFVSVIVSLPIIFNNVTDYAPPTDGESAFVIIIYSLAVLSCPVLLFLGTRLSLLLLKVEAGKSRWLYSIVSSLLNCVFAAGIPISIGYLLYRFGG